MRTFQGDFTADFPVQLPEGQNARSGSKRFNFTLGSGSARIELQSFGGDIVLARKAIVSRSEERRRRREGVAPVAQPPQPGQPPAPNPAPTPKPPKPPGFDGKWDAGFEHFDSATFEAEMKEWGEQLAKDFEFHFDEQQFQHRYDTMVAPKIEKNVEKIFEDFFKKGRQ